jgi:hypothetical protein
MLVLGQEQGHQHIDAEEIGQGLRYSPVPLARRSASSTETVGTPGRRGKTGTPRSKCASRIGYPTKGDCDELVNALAGLTSKIGESRLQRGIDLDRGVRHVSIVPRRVTHTEE